MNKARESAWCVEGGGRWFIGSQWSGEKIGVEVKGCWGVCVYGEWECLEPGCAKEVGNGEVGGVVCVVEEVSGVSGACWRWGRHSAGVVGDVSGAAVEDCGSGVVGSGVCGIVSVCVWGSGVIVVVSAGGGGRMVGV